MADIHTLLTKGVEEVIEKDHLETTLRDAEKTGRKLRVKFGIDPTAPDLHLGHTVALRKLRQFQDAGHTAVLIIGDFTAMIGDPTGRAEARKPLTAKEVRQNLKKYLKHSGKVLDIKKVEVNYNSKWLKKMGPGEIQELLTQFSVQQFIEREDFRNRIEAHKPLWINELLYPAFQAYDSVVVRADLEIGGRDQKFNLLAGRALMEKKGMVPQDILTLPLLEGTDGVRKMSKSFGNYIGLEDAPNEMFGKVMSVPDNLIEKYFTLLTDVSVPIRQLADSPRDAKVLLAKTLVEMYHSRKAADAAEGEFVRVFSKREAPSDMPEVKIGRAQKTLMEILVAAEPNESKSELRRLVEQGAVKLNDEVKRDVNEALYIHGGEVLKIGKRKFFKLQ